MFLDLGLTNKRALVTASSQGLGRAIALELLREGAHVVISSRDSDKLERVAAEIRAEIGSSGAGSSAVGKEAQGPALGGTGSQVGQLFTVAADVTDATQIQHLVREAAEKLGGLDILVTNAGGPPTGTFDQLTDDMWQRAVNLNLMSVVRLIRESLPHMRQAGGGKILNVSSISVKQPIKNLMLSNSIRSATVAFLKSLSIELAPENILIHNLAPGRIGTDRVKYLDTDRAKRENRTPEEVYREEVSGIPIGRYGTPEEFGKYAAFLLSDVNSYTTGETTYVDGGTVLSPW